MSPRIYRLRSLAGAVLAIGALGCGVSVAAAGAQGLEWRLEQPQPPPPPVGVTGAVGPVGLGRIGDMEFIKPNLGLLTTAGNGSTIPPGLWVYDGQGWHELATECGATDGRIAWAGPDEFWTVSDGRPGQAPSPKGATPPLADNTLCHFASGQFVGSYAAPAFSSNSYQPMTGAACLSSSDCWFGGAPLPGSQPGAFQLHWDGASVQAEPNPQVKAVGDINVFAGALFESVSPLTPAPGAEEVAEAPSIFEISPSGVFKQASIGAVAPPPGLSKFQLSADESSLWAAAGPESRGSVTVLRYSGGVWSQLLGPGVSDNFPEDVVNSVAAEPQAQAAWLALDTARDAETLSPTVSALLANISAAGGVQSEQTLPSAKEAEEGVGPKGAAERVVCPAVNDCWMATTQGWLFHLGDGGSLERDTDPAYSKLIAYRPADQGLPQVQPDEPPEDNSGLPGAIPAAYGSLPVETPGAQPFASVTLPLLSAIHSKLVHGTTLQLSFHLAVKARVRLIAKRGKRVVASTTARVLGAGNQRLLLKLNRRRWPTKLALETHALAPLPTVSSRSSSVETVSTRLAFPRTIASRAFGLLP